MMSFFGSFGSWSVQLHWFWRYLSPTPWARELRFSHTNVFPVQMADFSSRSELLPCLWSRQVCCTPDSSALTRLTTAAHSECTILTRYNGHNEQERAGRSRWKMSSVISPGGSAISSTPWKCLEACICTYAHIPEVSEHQCGASCKLEYRDEEGDVKGVLFVAAALFVKV